MKKPYLVTAVSVFIIAATLNTFGSSVLCESVQQRITISIPGGEHVVFTCEIPPNAVPVNKSLRVTSNLRLEGPSNAFATISTAIWLNGSPCFATIATNGTGRNDLQSLNFILSNLADVRYVIAGTGMSDGSTVSTFNQTSKLSSCPSTNTLPWSVGFPLQIVVAFDPADTGIVDGESFLVEIL